MTPHKPARVLLVDDEPHVLSAFRRQLRTQFTVETAVSGHDALARIAAAQPFAVVVSDYHMPQMDGATFLAQVRELSPASSRILLTGQADLHTAAAVVNDGGVFRFLLKPVSPETLLAGLAAGVDQHRLVTAERELLDKTLRSAVRALMDLLALANPILFARATRLRELARSIVTAAELAFDWDLDLTAMLSQIGAVTLPPATLEHLESGCLDRREQAMVTRLPELAQELLTGIPRLEPVCEAIQRQDGSPADPSVPLAARVLRLARDFDLATRRCGDDRLALEAIRARPDSYDPTLVAALARVIDGRSGDEVTWVALQDLSFGMVIAEDVLTQGGMRLVPGGHEVSATILQRLRNFASSEVGVREPIAVYEDEPQLQGLAS